MIDAKDAEVVQMIAQGFARGIIYSGELCERGEIPSSEAGMERAFKDALDIFTAPRQSQSETEEGR